MVDEKLVKQPHADRKVTRGSVLKRGQEISFVGLRRVDPTRKLNVQSNHRLAKVQGNYLEFLAADWYGISQPTITGSYKVVWLIPEMSLPKFSLNWFRNCYSGLCSRATSNESASIEVENCLIKCLEFGIKNAPQSICYISIIGGQGVLFPLLVGCVGRQWLVPSKFLRPFTCFSPPIPFQFIHHRWVRQRYDGATSETVSVETDRAYLTCTKSPRQVID